jgi:predicted Zn-dependent peptidase
MKYTKTVLKNGLRVVTIPMKDNPTVTVLVMVEAGSKYESKPENGLSHFLEHMCFKGTVNRPGTSDIASSLDNLGSHYNAFTSQEMTGYYAKADYRHLDKVLDIVSDLYLNPLFPEKEIEKEKGVIIEEINMYEDLPQRRVWEIFTELLYGDQPAGWSVAGTKENIRKMTRDNFVKYRAEFYRPGSTTVVVAGNFNEKRTISAISKIFGNLKKEKKGVKVKTIEKQTTPQIKIHLKDTDQTHLVLGLRTFNVYHKKNKILDVLVGVLSGGMSARLFKKMRDEMGICYYVRASADLASDAGYLAVSAGVDSSRVKEAVSALLEEFKKLKDKLVSVEELNKVKQYLSGTLYLGLESSDSLAEFFGGQEILNRPIKTADHVRKEIESVTAKDIQKLAQEIFVNKGLNLAIIGRFDNKVNFEDILKF